MRLRRRGVSKAFTIEIDPDNHVGGEYTVTTEPQAGVPGRIDHYCEDCNALLCTEEIPVLPIPAPTAEIDDVDVPLAGLFTRGDAIGYLWDDVSRAAQTPMQNWNKMSQCSGPGTVSRGRFMVPNPPPPARPGPRS